MTPKKEQIAEIRERHPECILLFRQRGNYWAYGEDADKLHRDGGLAVGYAQGTAHVESVANVGIKHLNAVLVRMLHAGHRVAVCGQMETTEFPVERIVTPGALVEDGQ